MISTHVCTKTYFVRNRMGDLVTITVTALFVKGLPQDLLGGKSVNRENIRVILDSDHDICGLYPLDKNHEQHYQDSIDFVEDQTDLYYEDMNWPTHDNLTGYDLWHRRLGHVPNRNIEQTIQHLIGLENLIGKTCKRDQKCPSCMLGKVRSRITRDQWIRPHKSWAGCTWICIHHPSHPLKGITKLSYSLTATVG